MNIFDLFQISNKKYSHFEHIFAKKITAGQNNNKKGMFSHFR